MKKNSEAASEALDAFENTTAASSDEIHKMFEDVKKFTDDNVPKNTASARDEDKTDIGNVSPEVFNGMAGKVAEEVFGQDEFIKKMVIAFKRPFVMPPEEGRALNSIFVSGKNDTGRHSVVRLIASEIASGKKENVTQVDLSLYGNAGDEKLFLQDMFSALSGNAFVIVFEVFYCQFAGKKIKGYIGLARVFGPW